MLDCNDFAHAGPIRLVFLDVDNAIVYGSIESFVFERFSIFGWASLVPVIVQLQSRLAWVEGLDFDLVLVVPRESGFKNPPLNQPISDQYVEIFSDYFQDIPRIGCGKIPVFDDADLVLFIQFFFVCRD